MSKIKIDKEDKNRILLTELLPYEVPMLFSNDGFYSIVSSGNFKEIEGKIKNLQSRGKYGIPFDFEIKKSNLGDTRTLSVIHPLNQLDFIDFYKKYDSVLLYLCSKSPFSLRKISKVAKFCYSPNLVFEEDKYKSREVEVEPDVFDRETKLLKSYFTYKPIDLIYKFYERYEYQRLEQKFNYLLEFDISKCFYNIYTHSITWAVKDKESAKRNSRKVSFENTFDNKMQLANYNETNGIIVGPEISRIFAEVILQQIDLNVLVELEKNGLKLGVEYEIRRYVDDYFVFSNNKNHSELILKSFKKELKKYKLYVNDSKTKEKTTPFITNIAVGKIELKQLMDNLFNSLIIYQTVIQEDREIKKITQIIAIRNPYSIARNFIKDFQCVVQRNNLNYDILSKDVVRYCKCIIVKIFNDKKFDKEKEVTENFLLLILDISFYAYSLNMKASTTFKLAQIIVLICKFLEGKREDLRHDIFSKISRDAEFSITIHQRKAKKNETNVETLNLLIALKILPENYLLSEEKIKALFTLKTENDFRKLNYFHIITLLYYSSDNISYDGLRGNLEKVVIFKFSNDNDPFKKAELTMLFFDFINCPFVSVKAKKELMRESKYVTKGKTVQSEIDKIMKHKIWFMDWGNDIDLERVLKKKECGSSY